MKWLHVGLKAEWQGVIMLRPNKVKSITNKINTQKPQPMHAKYLTLIDAKLRKNQSKTSDKCNFNLLQEPSTPVRSPLGFDQMYISHSSSVRPEHTHTHTHTHSAVQCSITCTIE